jgi:hypothetical protein
MGDTASPTDEDDNKQRSVADIIADPLKAYRQLLGLPPTVTLDDTTKTQIVTDMHALLGDFLKDNPEGTIEIKDQAGKSQKFKIAKDGNVHKFKDGKLDGNSSGNALDPTDPMAALLTGTVVEMATQKMKLEQDRKFEIAQRRLAEKLTAGTTLSSADIVSDIKKDKDAAILKLKAALPPEKENDINYYVHMISILNQQQSCINPDVPFVPYAANDPGYQKLAALNDIVHGVALSEDKNTLKDRTEVPGAALKGIKINDRLFPEEIYEQFRNPKYGYFDQPPYINVESLGYPKGTLFTKHQVCQVATEFLVARAIAELGDPELVTKAIIEGRLSLDPEDFHMAFRGSSPGTNLDCDIAFNALFGDPKDVKVARTYIPEGLYKPGDKHVTAQPVTTSGTELIEREAKRWGGTPDRPISIYTLMGGLHSEPGAHGWSHYMFQRYMIYYPNLQKEKLGIPTVDPERFTAEATANAPQSTIPQLTEQTVTAAQKLSN